MQSSATAPPVAPVGTTATAAAPEAAAVMPAAVVAHDAMADGMSAQPAAAGTADSSTADDPALEALLQAPAAEPMDVDSAALSVDTGADVSTVPGSVNQLEGVAAAAAPG